MDGEGTDRSRRSVLRAVLQVLATGMPAASMSGRVCAQSQDKMTKARAEYQEAPNGIYSCATCTLFVPPAGCKVVEGEISPDGWCKAFALAD
jgi:hypothetical protein